MPFAAKPVPELTPENKLRFLSLIAVGDENQCWNCEGDPKCGGYGFADFQGRKHYLHRIAWTVFRGPIPDRLNVLHTCDNPACCNPTHLFTGTHTDNMRDKQAKGRGNYQMGDAHHARLRPEEMARGSENGSAKLTESQVLEIRAARKSGISRKAVAEKYQIHEATVKGITPRKSWTHI